MTQPPVLSTYQATKILAARSEEPASVTTSLDLNRSRIELTVDREGLHLPGGAVVGWEVLREIAEEDRKVFALGDGEPLAVHLYSDKTGWVRTLCPTESAPTVLVSGFPMHRIKDCNPIKDTEAKIRAFGKVRGRVLDTATGLGYTAIQAARSASEVVTIELDPVAIGIARFNPWSLELFTDSKITQVIGDAFEEVSKLPSGSFSGIIHDPPTFALAGELYSGEFYRGLRRLLKPGGVLFHYIGDPHSGHGKKHYPGIMKRLAEAGFTRAQVVKEAFGLIATAR